MSEVPVDEDPNITDILGYWFQGVKQGDETELNQTHQMFWFMRNAMVDHLIRSNYTEVWEKVRDPVLNGEEF